MAFAYMAGKKRRIDWTIIRLAKTADLPVKPYQALHTH